MPADLLNIFHRVAERVLDRRDSLIGLERCSSKAGSGVGFEAWLKVEAMRALIDFAPQACNNGPDLELKNGDSRTTIELKAATDLNCTPSEGLHMKGVCRYTGSPDFAGCIFLADGGCEERLENLAKISNVAQVQLVEYFRFPVGKRIWVIGLLTPKNY